MKPQLPTYLHELHCSLLTVNSAPLECDGHTLMLSPDESPNDFGKNH